MTHPYKIVSPPLVRWHIGEKCIRGATKDNGNMLLTCVGKHRRLRPYHLGLYSGIQEPVARYCDQAVWNWSHYRHRLCSRTFLSPSRLAHCSSSFHCSWRREKMAECMLITCGVSAANSCLFGFFKSVPGRDQFRRTGINYPYVRTVAILFG